MKRLILLVLFLGFGMPTGWSEEGGRTKNDSGLASAVSRQLEQAAGVSSHLIDVHVAEGIVTLEGSVDNILARDRAARVAGTLRGVRAVVNRVTVRPLERPDDAIRADVAEALADDPVAKDLDIDVSVENGAVTLSGSVESWPERHLSGNVAKGVRGVRLLDNDLVVHYGEERADEEIRADIENRLEWNMWVETENLEVRVENGNVFLSGKVSSADEKSRALLDAWVEGVQSVEGENLLVDPDLEEGVEQQDAYVPRTDEEIRQAVLDALAYDPRVYSFQPEVGVRKQVVTLRGTVDNLRAKRAAEADARNTTGVLQVNNFLKVRPNPLLEDVVIANEIRQRFERDPYVDRFQIDVQVRNAKVFLYGSVDTLFEKEHAEDIVTHMTGVADVENYLAARTQEPELGDEALENAIEDALFWSPYIHSEEVQISAEDGVVTLNGKVENWRSWQAAIDNAYEAGARRVINMIEVNPGGTA